ncbi:MAG: BREX system Lon protease-like protein BrxL [Anaerolineales bacterium]|nr:BREX system Lon protease-like protein BrxL [Anaerolineales bacterium]
MSLFDSTTMDDPAETATSKRDDKVLSVFGNLAIDKRRLPMSQLQKRGVPAYVAEWVLDSIVPGQGPLTEAEAAKVQAWANKFIPGPGDANLLKNRLMSGELVKVLNPVQVEIELTRKRQDRVAKLSLLGIHDGVIGEGIIDAYPDLLQQGMWGVVELIHTQEGITLSNFRPMQATVNLQLYKEARRRFTLDEWRELMLISMGYNPKAFNLDEQLLLLCRLLPLVQKNMHMIELAPKGTGKSYIYENVSPSVRLVSGGNISPAVLFVNNQSGQWGLLARFAVVVLDEVQTLRFEKPEEIIGGLKGFLANGRLTRGGLHETASDCGLVMLANIKLDSQQKPLHNLFIQELPSFLQETAFLDRIRALIPGWEIRKLSGECFARGVGLKSDFFGDALLSLRDDLEHDQRAARRIELLGDRVYKRNEDAVHAIASGMLKILFPHGQVSRTEFEQYCVKPARHLRQLVWNQLQILDGEYRQYENLIRYQILDE